MRLRPAHVAWPLGIAAVLLLLVLGTVAALMASERGSRALVEAAVSIAGIPLRVDDMRGTLLRGVTAERLVYRTESTEVTILQLSLTPAWFSSLADDRLVLRQLSANQMEIRTGLDTDGEAMPQPLEFEMPRMPVTLMAETLEVGRVRYNDLDADWSPSVAGAVYWSNSELRVRSLAVIAPNYGVTSELLELDLDGDQHLEGALQWDAMDDRYAGFARLSGTLVRIDVAHTLTAPLAITASGTIDLVGHVEPFLTFNLHAPEFAYEGIVSARDVRVAVAGTLGDYQGEIGADVDVLQRFSGVAEAYFAGNLEQLAMTPLTFDGDAGLVAANGTLTWTPALRIEAGIEGRSLDPEAFGAPLMEGSLALDGRLEYIDGVMDALIDELAGTVRGVPVTASGDLRFADAAWSTEALIVRSGTNRVTASGRWRDEVLEADLRLALDDLAQLAPGVAGELHGRVAASGGVDTMVASADLNSQLLRWHELEFRQISLAAQRTAEGRNRLDLAADELHYGELRADALSLTGRGDDTTVDFDLALRVPDQPESSLSVSVTRREDGVAMTVDAGADFATGFGRWQLDRRVDAEFGAGMISVSPHCWGGASAGGRVCIERLVRDDEQMNLAGDVDALPLRFFNLFAPELPTFAGELHAAWTVHHDMSADVWEGEANWHTAGFGLVGLMPALDNEVAETREDESLDLPELVGRARFDLDHVEATLIADLADERVVDALLRLDDLTGQQSLDGRIGLSLRDTAFLATFHEALGEFQGAVSGEVRLTGTMQQPSVSGRMDLLDGSLVWLDPYIEFERLVLGAEMDDLAQIRITGRAESGEGHLALEGHINQPLESARAVRVSLSGREMLVRIPDSEVWVAPNLVFTFAEQQANLRGTVEVPRAQITVAEIPETAVSRSADVVVVGRDAPAAQPTRLAAHVRVIMRDEVRIAGFGLEARVGGDLSLQQTREGATLLHGRVDIREGEFTAYGQTFDIDTGNLTYAGPPMNPFVNARALRRLDRTGNDEVTVGILITGDLQNLESTLFADPPMSEGNALSYLILGRPLRDSSAQEGDQLIGAAVALGLRQAAPIIDELRSAFGLDELVAVGAAADDVTLIAGKRISSRLYMRYSYQAFLGVSALMLRYDLTDRLSLETTASEHPGLDVMYRVTDN